MVVEEVVLVFMILVKVFSTDEALVLQCSTDVASCDVGGCLSVVAFFMSN